MSNQIKYTSDGKKVKVIGKLNNHETIVQEIFVSGDSEIPSGENFTVKSLHDNPSISWKEKRIKEIEKKYDLISNSLPKKIRELETKIRKESENTRTILLQLKEVQKNITNDSFSLVIDFLSGNITHVLTLGWGTYKIQEFKDAVKGCASFGDSMRLASFWGKSNGDTLFRLNRYSDGSGSDETVVPCRSYEDAVTALEEYIDSQDKVNTYMINAAEKYGIDIPKEKLLAYYESEKSNIEKSLSSHEQQIVKSTEKMNLLNESIKALK